MRGRLAVAAFGLALDVCMAGSLDLCGEWQVKGEGFAGRIVLPGTLSEGGYGSPESYGTWSALTNRRDRGALRMIRTYEGKATYSREVDVPRELADRELELFLERVMWVSSVKVDGIPIGTCDSLGTPHRYRLKICAGRHLFTIEIDNAGCYGFAGNSHGWGHSTQGKWHGIIGRMTLQERNPLDEVQVFAPYPTKTIRIMSPEGLKIEAILDGHRLTADGSDTYRLGFDPDPWSEFHPRLYRLELRSGSFRRTVRVGFRTVRRAGNQLFINDMPLWVRADVDNCQFPLTGYPAMTAAEWKRQMRIQKENGCNALRFHTWTPPEAAFEAADELGLYLFVETGYWGGRIGQGEPGLDAFCRKELDRIVSAYGNAPSFVGLEVGNELGGADFELMSKWMSEIKERDDRRLTQCSTARAIASSDDYMVTHCYPGVGPVRCRHRDNTDWDYEDVYAKTRIPTIAHEIGQWPVYPMWTDIGRFDGLLRAYDWEEMRDRARTNGTLRFNRRYHAASLKTSRFMYKDEVEGFLRTPSCAGLQLLDVRDYTGQGEALVGWLDAFFDAKPGLAELPSFSDVLRPIAFLMRTSRFVYRAGEAFAASFEIRNMTEEPIPAGTAFPYSFAGKCGWLKLPRPAMPGEITPVGRIEVTLDRSLVDRRQELRFGENRWSVFVMGGDAVADVPAGVVLTSDPDVAGSALKDGKRVVYVGRSRNALAGRFVPIYWSSTFFPVESGCPMLGTWFAEDHPVFNRFPTEDWMDRQWRSMSESALVHELTGAAAGLDAIAMPVPDIHVSRYYATMFEARVGTGRLFVCGYPIGSPTTPESCQLRKSVLDYVGSSAFVPKDVVPNAWFESFAAGKCPGDFDRTDWSEWREADGSVKLTIRNCPHCAGTYTLVFGEDGYVTATFEGRGGVRVISAAPVIYVSAESVAKDADDGEVVFRIVPSGTAVPPVKAVYFKERDGD